MNLPTWIETKGSLDTYALLDYLDVSKEVRNDYQQAPTNMAGRITNLYIYLTFSRAAKLQLPLTLVVKEFREDL